MGLTLFVDVNEYTYDPDTPSDRVRELDDWKIHHEPEGWYLSGWTVKEADGTRPPARHTTTSHLRKIEGRVCTTRSGSKYTLLDPAEGFSLEDLPQL